MAIRGTFRSAHKSMSANRCAICDTSPARAPARGRCVRCQRGAMTNSVTNVGTSKALGHRRMVSGACARQRIVESSSHSFLDISKICALAERVAQKAYRRPFGDRQSAHRSILGCFRLTRRAVYLTRGLAVFGLAEVDQQRVGGRGKRAAGAHVAPGAVTVGQAEADCEGGVRRGAPRRATRWIIIFATGRRRTKPLRAIARSRVRRRCSANGHSAWRCGCHGRNCAVVCAAYPPGEASLQADRTG